MDACAEQLIVDARLNEIGRLGAGRTGIVVDGQVLRHLLLTGLTVHTDTTLTGYHVLANSNVQARFARRAPATADLLVGTLPDIGDYVRWAMILPPNGSLGDLTAQDAVLSRMEGWHPQLRTLIEQADPDNSTLLSIRAVKPGERWASGPVTLLGDAIHATSPTGGNGANTALRDADLLRRCLIEAGEGRQELLRAVDDYERQMFEYGAEAVRSSLEKLPAFAPEAKLS